MLPETARADEPSRLVGINSLKPTGPLADPDVVALPYTASYTGPSQTKVLGPVVVREVDFVGDAIAVVADPGREPYPSGPEYNDANTDGVIDSTNGTEWQLPTAIVRNTKPKVTTRSRRAGNISLSRSKANITTRVMGARKIACWTGRTAQSRRSYIDAESAKLLTYDFRKNPRVAGSPCDVKVTELP